MKKNVKRLFITLSVAALGALSIAGLAACGDSPTHTHTYTNWSVSDTEHWRTTVCSDHSTQEEKAAHTYNGTTCSVCGYDSTALEYIGASTGYAVKVSASGKTKSKIIVPATVNDFDIIAIEAFGFEEAAVSEISLPATVKTIGREAFSGCTKLGKVDLSGTVLTTIENATFLNCTSITEVKLPESVKTIKPGAFEGCAKLEGITLPEGLTSLGEQAFGRCTSLKSITLPEGVTRINNNLFQGCTKLSTVSFGNVTYIGDNAFAHCTSLKTIDLGTVLQHIGQYAFRASGLTEITVPESVGYYVNEESGNQENNPMRTIGAGAFTDCTSLKKATIKASINYIYADLFSGCSALEELTLPFVGSHKTVSSGTLTTKFGFVFGTATPTDASKFTKVGSYYIPNSLKKVTVLGGTISAGAFDGCSMLEEIKYASGVLASGVTSFDGCTATLTQI